MHTTVHIFAVKVVHVSDCESYCDNSLFVHNFKKKRNQLVFLKLENEPLMYNLLDLSYSSGDHDNQHYIKEGVPQLAVSTQRYVNH